MNKNQGAGATLDGKFTDGGPGVDRSTLGAAFMNMLLDELVFVVEDAGLTLNNADHQQLRKAIRLQSWPIGSIYEYDGPVPDWHPNQYFGGTWTAHSPGRALVGVDATDPDFDTQGNTYGSKTNTVTNAHLPPHWHLNGTPTSPRNQVYGGTALGLPGTATASIDDDETLNTQGITSSIVESLSGGPSAPRTTPAVPLNNVQPSYAVKRWKRIA